MTQNKDIQTRIEALEEELHRRGGFGATFREMPLEMELGFLERVLAYDDAINSEERGPSVGERLAERGVSLAPPDLVSDDAVHAALWFALDALAECSCFLSSTNHMTDRELYTYVHERVLISSNCDMSAVPTSSWVWDPVCTGDEESREIFLAYYADDETRADCASWGEEVPDKQKPVVERDHLLPSFDQRPPAIVEKPSTQHNRRRRQEKRRRKRRCSAKKR